MPKRLDLSGEKYGRLTVTEYSHQNNHGKSIWKCLCECGTEVSVVGAGLKRGHTTSCGCTKTDNMVAYNTTHGMKGTRTYNVWNNMKSRCNDSSRWDAEYYSTKGITYDTRWEKFEEFFEDMGEVPEGLSLDRIDPSGNYCKENCRWATYSLQGYNQEISKSNTSGKTGVHFSEQSDKWIAAIGVENTRVNIGSFVTFEEAVKAREEAELKYFGFSKE